MAEKFVFVGSDVTDAIDKACKKLNVAQEGLDIEVVKTGSGGIFGLIRRKAQIQVSLKQPEKDAEQISSGDSALVVREDSSRSVKKGGSEHAAIPIPPEVFPAVEKNLGDILDRMGFPSTVTVTEHKGKVLAQINGDYEEEIVGPEGQTLDGLQFLLRKIISRAFPGRILVSLDAGNFRERRKQDLEEKAERLAAQVKETGKTRMLPALNPSERRIVHICLQKDDTIRSRSVGEGVFKKVLIYLPGKGKRRPPRRRRNTAASQ